MKDLLKKYWWLLIAIVVTPVIVNYVLLIPAFGPVVGDNVHWLAFWGSYLTSLVSAMIAFLILFIQRRDNHNENKHNRQLQINVLKYQQEMQWLNEKREILIDFALSLSKDDLIELSNKIAANQDILSDIKNLLANLVKNDSRVGFMRVSEKTESFKEFNTKCQSAFNTHRDALLDLQEIYILFMRTPVVQRVSVLHNRLQQGLIHSGLRDIIFSYPLESVFLQQNPVEISLKLIATIPNLLEDTRNVSLTYIKAEEERIAKLLEEN